MIAFIDLEMKPVEKDFKAERRICPHEVIEFGAVMLNDQREECDSFVKIVKPQFGPIPPRYEELTGVTNAMAAEAIEFSEALLAFSAWCRPADIIYAWSGSDYRQLKLESRLKSTLEYLRPLEDRWADYQRLFTDKLGLSRELSLEQAVNICGLSFEGHMHDALWDARNTAAVYRIAEDPVSFQEKLAPLRESINTKVAPTTSMASLLADKLKGLNLDE